MRANDLILRILAEKKDGQWVVMCLDFSLAAQADTLAEAKLLLESQMVDYVNEALVGQDKEHAGVLMSRRAPLQYWLKYWFARAIHKHGRRTKAITKGLPMHTSMA